MRLNLTRHRQTVMGTVFAFGGTAAILVSLLRDRSALTMTPGVEGSLTACVVGVALALSEGVAFATVAATALPIFLLQYLACRNAGEPSLAMIGLEAVILGLIGLVAPSRAAARARSSAPASAAGQRSSALVRVHVSA